MKDQKMMWGFMLHLGTNMWGRKGQKWPWDQEDQEKMYHDELYCDKEVWRKITDFLPQCGINTLLIDVGEGIKLDSHPELANPGSWEKKEVVEEIKRLKNMGITPIPKLNFSCSHDAWLKDYAYMVGTDIYYRVCEEVLSEVIELFGRPELFHLGLDEETLKSQPFFPIARIRSPYKMIEDSLKLFDVCKSKGVRPWMWLDVPAVESFGGEEEFRQNIPKDVLISNWYYNEIYADREKQGAKLYVKLAEWGYEQVPTCSNWFTHLNPRQTLRFCKENVDPASIRGYLDAPWMFCQDEMLYALKNDAWRLAHARKRYYPETL